MKILLPLESLDNAAVILNEVRQEQGLSAIWSADRFLALAINGDLDLTVLLPEKFSVERKDDGPKFLDTPLRPSAPKGAVHFFIHKPELFALSVQGSTPLNSIVSISNDGVRTVLHSVKPPMNIAVSDLRISSEQLIKYVAEQRPSANATLAKKHKLRTNLLDAPIRKAIELAASLEPAAVFVQLRELALQEERPFTGQFDQGAPCCTDDNLNIATLTKESLAKRLKKHSL